MGVSIENGGRPPVSETVVCFDYISDDIDEFNSAVKIETIAYEIDRHVQISVSLKQEGLQVGFDLHLEHVHHVLNSEVAGSEDSGHVVVCCVDGISLQATPLSGGR